MKRFLSATILSVMAAASHAAVATSQSYDKYSKATTITTGQLKVADGTHGWLDPSFAKAWMSATVGKGGATAFALNVYYYSGNGWSFFSSAKDSDGGDFEFAQVDRSIIMGDTISEQFLIVLKPDYVTAHQATGLDVKFYGKGRELLVAMPADQLQAIAAAATAAAGQVTSTSPATASSAPAAVAAASAP